MTLRHKHAELIHLWCEGAEIEARQLCSQAWHKDTNPLWLGSMEYRIKRETVKVRLYVNKHDPVLYMAFEVNRKTSDDWTPCSEVVEIEVMEP